MPFLVAAGIGAGGSLLSGLLGSNASKNAANAQVQAANTASATEQNLFNQGQQEVQPFVTGGTNALNALLQSLGVGSPGGPTNPILSMLGIGPGGATGGGINPSTFQGSPGYQFQKQQGEQAVTNAARGNIGGNTLRAIDQYGTGFANQSWDQYLQQAMGGWNSLINPLQNVAGIGGSAAGSVFGQGNQLGATIGGNQIGAGNAQGAGIMGANNALTGGINGVGSDALTYALLNAKYGNSGGGPPQASWSLTAPNSGYGNLNGNGLY